MRRISRSRRGLSEIVGALMLVLIVVVAATALSAFVASYQKQLQAEQAIHQDRTLESLTILHAAPPLNATETKLAQLQFTVASLSVNPSTITRIEINHQPLQQYNTSRLDLASG